MALVEGYELKKHFTVKDSDTAKVVGSGGLSVLGTPILATWIEGAAYDLLELNLPDAQTSVGVKLDLNHTSPTPVGMKVTVIITVKDIDKRRCTFSFTATDEQGSIADGIHERVVVDKERFMQKVLDKKNGSE